MEKLTFYEISEQMSKIEKAIDECVDSETGEVIDDKYDELCKEFDDLGLAEQEKTEGVALMVKNRAAFLEALKEEKKRISDRIQTVQNEIDRTKSFLDSYVLKGEKFETPRVRCSYRKSKAVEIIEENEIPEKYLKVKTTTAPDKTAIKEALTSGELVPGCNLRENSNLSIK